MNRTLFVRTTPTGARRARLPWLAASLLVSLSTSMLSTACRDQPLATPPPSAREAASAASAAPKSAHEAASAASAAPKSAEAFVPERVQGSGTAMGTHIAFAAYTEPTIDAAGVRQTFDAAIEEIKRLEALMTTWRPDSEVSRINAAAGKSAVKVGDETFAVIAESVRTSEISEGTFDITFQTLHGLWKFDEDLDPHPPSDAAIRARLPFVDFRNIKLDPASKSVMLTKRETKIGLGGIAKGYAVDKAVHVLDRAGLTSFFVQAGGDLFARGRKPGGKPWQAGIRDPRGPEDKFFARLAVIDHAFSTAGDYERAYIVDGKRYHHIIDPRTGQPATACRSVTIWAPTAFLADAIDDAVFILGPEKGMKLVDSLEGVGAVIVDAHNNVGISRRLRGKLELAGVPSDGI